jgi:thiol-disulfide isomerase/thioredoxin
MDASMGLKLPRVRLIVLAALAGVVAGALAVYVRETGSGNNAPLQASAAPADAVCAASQAKGKAVADAATGEVAALLAADQPTNLSTLAFNDPSGKPMSLADHSGKTVLLNLWATWCAPCRAEMPALDQLQARDGSDRFEVVAVNVDTGDDSKPKAFLSETGVHALGYYRDNTLTLFNELKKRGLALGLPVTLLIDPQGCLLAGMNGPAHWAGPDAERVIKTALGG